MNTICPNCKVSERSYDGESDGYFTHCFSCFGLFADAPYCHHLECARRVCGTRTVLTNGLAASRGATALYECSRIEHAHGAQSAIEWSTQEAIESAQYDWASENGLLEIRLRLREEELATRVQRHPIWEANATAYAETARALIEASSTTSEGAI